jgi:endonuclease VIII
MPEGPSIVILRESVQAFKGKKIVIATGNAKIDIPRLNKLKVVDFKSWGKHFLICFDGFYLRVHFLMFGSYRINEKKESPPRLSLKFKEGELNFYTCSVKMFEGDVNDVYEWEADVMNDHWNEKKAKEKLKKLKHTMVCDVLLNQEIFAGVGNIIKNEILFRIRVHPETLVSDLSAMKTNALIKDARVYSFDFYRWKKKFVLRKHWQVYKQKMCPRCTIKLVRGYSGKTDRLTFYCKKCQRLYKK